jgi:AcrR family transcriptional regulator
MDCQEALDARTRIVEAATQLFALKGCDATRVNEIADAAGVTKALIYYYFPSKEAILDYLIRELVDDLSSIATDFVNQSVLQMIREGHLDIKPDRLSFANENARDRFLKCLRVYCERVLDHAIAHRAILRILLLESLKDHSKHHNILLKIYEPTRDATDGSLLRAIVDADSDFCYSDDLRVFKVFFNYVPIVTFASYYDNFQSISGMTNRELRESFLSSLWVIVNSMVSGSEVLLRTKSTGG